MLNILLTNNKISGVLFWVIVGFLLIILLIEIVSILKNIFCLDNEEDNIAGFGYDRKQDIYYSVINAWQAKYGYTKMYDRFAVFASMIFDSEPIKFKYGKKKYLIEFWKGQYGITTGGEIGVYCKDLTKPFWKRFVYQADTTNLLKMRFDLFKNDKYLFNRDSEHWWLTGFKLGEFSSPHDLKMLLKITIDEEEKLNAFVSALRRVGYNSSNFRVSGKTVSLFFDRPYTKQPKIKNSFIGRFSQRRNRLLAIAFRQIMGSVHLTRENLEVIKKINTKLYHKVLKLCKFSKYCFESELNVNS